MTGKTMFTSLMGDSPQVRVLEYLLIEREIDFSMTDMASNSGIGRATLYRIWKGLIKNNLVIPTREIGNAKLFKLNTENPKVRELIRMYDKLLLGEK